MIFDEINKHTNPKIVITTHHKPDGDAMGSTLGLYNLFLNIGISSVVITPTDYADFLTWLPGNDNVLIYEGNESKSHDLVENADFIFCLDFNKYSRLNDLGNKVKESKAQKVLIDHHQEPEQIGNMTWWNPKACSTCELVYRMAVAEGKKSFVDQKVAQCIYTGIMTDTGNFKYRGTNSDTHRIVAELLDTGMNQTEIHELVYDSFTEKRLRLIGFALSQRMEILSELNTALIYLNAQDLKDFEVKTGDTDGLVNYGLSLKGIKLAVLIIDRTKLIKMSFRSKNSFDVNAFAKKHFNGGGHINAAGGSSEIDLEQTIENFKIALNLYKNELI
jgi:phosphoesterase RecJ-like protein